MDLTKIDREAYRRDGFVVARGFLNEEYFRDFEHELSILFSRRDLHTDSFAEHLRIMPKEALAWVYEKARGSQWLWQFCAQPALTAAAGHLLNRARWRLTDHCRFRMDQPHDTRWLALWHQDHAYVGGHIDTITAWVPLQDVDWSMGPLLVVPGSHYTERPHTREVNGRRCPQGTVFDGELKMLEVRRGDVIFFHSCLLHSGQVNLSDRVRYSVQARFEPL